MLEFTNIPPATSMFVAKSYQSKRHDSPRRNYIISILRWLVSILLSVEKDEVIEAAS